MLFLKGKKNLVLLLITFFFLQGCSNGEITILYDDNIGNKIEINADRSNEILLPVPSLRPGYEFLGWYYDNNIFSELHKSRDVINNVIKKNLSVYAYWKPISYKVVLDKQDGSTIETINYTINDEILLNGPTRDGYIFEGWFLTKELSGNAKTSIGKGSIGNLTLYAKWSKYYTVQFNTNGGVILSPQKIKVTELLSNVTIPTREGYEFIGWFLDENLTSGIDGQKMPNRDLILHAKWKQNFYILSFDSNGGSLINPSNLAFAQMIRLPGAPRLIGSDFLGWFLDPGLINPFNLVTMPSRNIMLYAKWGPSAVASGGGGGGGGGGSSTPVVVPGTTTTTPPPPVVPPTTEEDTSQGESSNDESTDEIAFTTTFVMNGGTEISPISITEGEIRNLPLNPTRTGYQFVGWYSNQALTTEFTGTTIAEVNMTLYAKWLVLQFEITFNSNGGTSISNIRSDFNAIIVSPTAPIRVGHNFDGWYESINFTGTAFEFTTMPAQNITLYAKWNANSYTISFDSNGGSQVAAITQSFGTNINAPVSPNRQGYELIGWFATSTSETPYEFTTMESENILLTARWRINQYTISFESRAGSSVESITLDYDSSIVMPTNPTRQGYNFQGWYTNSELTNEFNLTRMPANNLVLYAKWE
jgi:uncharacterized repeat protein (TIGR02543 family)